MYQQIKLEIDYEFNEFLNKTSANIIKHCEENGIGVYADPLYAYCEGGVIRIYSQQALIYTATSDGCGEFTPLQKRNGSSLSAVEISQL